MNPTPTFSHAVPLELAVIAQALRTAAPEPARRGGPATRAQPPVLTLQEGESQRLVREQRDEFGLQLTVLRADVAGASA